MIVGTVTLLFGAWIGCAKDDIKKVLAGSTMSQIGYMMLAAGIGPAGYAFAIFLLLAHGFFKANMFLGAGSVMHGMNDDVNMRHYGALGEGDADHVRTRSRPATWRSSGSRSSPATTPRITSSRSHSSTTRSSACLPCWARA